MKKLLVAASFAALLALPTLAGAADGFAMPAGDAEAHAQGIYKDAAPMSAMGTGMTSNHGSHADVAAQPARMPAGDAELHAEGIYQDPASMRTGAMKPDSMQN